MAIAPFLAMTAAEMQKSSASGRKIAWMACHFSPYGTGLSNVPKHLPSGALLMVDDITPPYKQDPVFMAEQLSVCLEDFHCCGIVLDFQQEHNAVTQDIAKYLTQALPCPVVVSERYAKDLDCPVLLSPVPLSVALKNHLSPWKGRQIWLEVGLDAQILRLTEQGCEAIPLSCTDLVAEGFSEPELHCHYTIETDEKSAGFTLWRTKEDIAQLLAEAETLGIAEAVGLYQELDKYL